MPFEPGNKLAVGNKGGGRTRSEELTKKAVFKTIEERINKALDKRYNPNLITRKIADGKATAWEIIFHKLMAENPGKLLDKIAASKQHIQGEVTGDINLFFEPAVKND